MWLRRRFFKETWWNYFDLVIVLAWLMDRSNAWGSINPALLRVARLAKLARLLRVMRWLQMVQPLIIMVKALAASISVLTWSLLLMLIMMAMVAMVMSVLLEPWMRSEYLDPESLAMRIAVYKSWGTFSRAITTVSELTIGNFGPPTRELENNVGGEWGMAALLYKLTVGSAAAQVINAVFIQQTFKVATRDEEIMIKEKASAAVAYGKQLAKLFDHLDDSRDGIISRDEFKEALEDDNIRKWFSVLEVDADDMLALFDVLAGEDGLIERHEFTNGLKSVRGTAKHLQLLIMETETRRNFQVVNENVERIARLLGGGDQGRRLLSKRSPSALSQGSETGSVGSGSC